MKWIDLPPVWLLAALLLARWLAALAPWPRLGGWADWLGAALVLAGLALMAAAAWEFRRVRTTIIPHRSPQHLISAGVFAWSRNPIYLGDALILAGAILYWGALLPLVLVPAFVAVVTARFIRPEEARLAAAFPDGFAAYGARVRRWL